MVPGNAAALEALAADVLKAGRHLDTGIVGTKWLFESLSQSGRADLALAVVTNPTYPARLPFPVHFDSLTAY